MTTPRRRVRWPSAPRGVAGGADSVLTEGGGGLRLRLWLSMAVALGILNFALTFHNVWPTLWITTRHELSVELAALLLGLALYSAVVRVPSPRVMSALAVVLVLFSIGRYAEVTAPALYGRPVNLYWDGPHVLNVATMLKVAAAPLTVVLGAMGLIALLVAAFVLIRWSLVQVRAGLDFKPVRRALTMLSAVLVALYLAGYMQTPLHTLRWFSLPVTATYWKQAAFTLEAYRQAQNPDVALCAQSPGDYDLSRFGGADVFVMFMESYGATAYDRADIAAVVAPARAGLADAAAVTGRGVMSAFVQSPTFGGASWLAHATLLTGRPIRDNGTYNLLLTQDCDVLTKGYARNGYRVVSLMPGLKREWPEGSFYGFDEIYGEPALQYRGPEFGWWRIPDQYALAKLDEQELRNEPRSPLLLFFPTISSHMPFRPTPPYQPDWPRVLSAEPYDANQVAASLAVTPNWTDLGADYAATIAYTFNYLSGYLRDRADLDLVLVVLGDHQPPSSVSGEGVRWDVPVHVIATRQDLLDSLASAGFVAGVEPAPVAIGPMHELTSLLLGAPVTELETGFSVAGQSGIDVAGAGGPAVDQFRDAARIEPLGQL